jgi:hypothetical protein
MGYTYMSSLSQNLITHEIFTGRAALIAGQGLSAITPAQILRSCGITMVPNEGMSLQDYLLDAVHGPKIAATIDELEKRTAAPEARRVCSAPWALVVSTSIDSSFVQVLSETNGEARRLRNHFVDQAIPDSLPKRPTLLDVYHLSRISDERRSYGQFAGGRRWRQISQLSQPALLNSLAAKIGPVCRVCIAGLKKDELLDWRLVASSLADFDPERVVWFLAPDDGITSDQITDELPNITVVHTPLDEYLRSAEESTGDRERIAELRSAILDQEDLVVSVRAEDAIKRVVFRASELRDFRHHLEILPDLSDRPAISDIDERRIRFIRFLGNPRLRPDYDGISEGFCFARDAYHQALELTRRRLRQRPFFSAGAKAARVRA